MIENNSAPEGAKCESPCIEFDRLASHGDAAEIASLIKEARQQKRLSQKELAELAGITPVQLCRIESGGSRPSKQTLQKLSAYVGIPYSELLLQAGYNNMKGDDALYKRDGSKLDVEALVESIYKVDSDFLEYFREFEIIGTDENLKIIKILLSAMRKAAEIDASSIKDDDSVEGLFRNTFMAVKRFIISALAPLAESSVVM